MPFIITVFKNDLSDESFNLPKAALMAEEKVEPSTCSDWAKCILCQDKTRKTLQCPGNTLRGHVEYGSGYHTLANNILRFNELISLPTHSDLEIAKLEEGDGIAATSIKRNVKRHKT